MANTVLAKMAVMIAANTAEFNQALKKSSKDINSFTSTITKAAGALGIAFGAQQIASFGLEVAKLAGQAESVEAAFKRLKGATALMVQLKEATGGTVSELELMKRAVQASNFDISLSALPKLLEFATLRAQQTGQSVDYLVDSIVTGIGRKSKLILDNLGISATQLAAEFKGASLEAQSVADVTEAVGRIAERNLKNMAGFSQNAATGLQQLAASWDDLKVSIGKLINQAGLPKFIEELASIAKFFAGDFTLSKEQVDKTAVALGELIKQAKNRDEFVKYTKMLAELTSQYGLLRDQALEPATDSIKAQKTEIELLDEAIKRIEERFGKLNTLSRKAFEAPLTPGKLGDATGTLSAPTTISKKVIDDLKLLPPQVQPILTEVETMFSNMEDVAKNSLGIIGSSFEAAFSGAYSGVQILARATADIIDLFAKQAIAAAIANAAKAGGPFPFAAVALATAAAGAMKGLLSRVGLKSPSISGGVGSGTFSRPSVASSSFADVRVSGRLVGEGSTLVAVIDNARISNTYRKG